MSCMWITSSILITFNIRIILKYTILIDKYNINLLFLFFYTIASMKDKVNIEFNMAMVKTVFSLFFLLFSHSNLLNELNNNDRFIPKLSSKIKISPLLIIINHKIVIKWRILLATSTYHNSHFNSLWLFLFSFFFLRERKRV